VPHLADLYGEKPVYNCENNLYPMVFPFLMGFNVFISILNLSTYCNHSKKLKKAIAQGGEENVLISGGLNTIISVEGEFTTAEEEKRETEIMKSEYKCFSIFTGFIGTWSVIAVVLGILLKIKDKSLGFKCQGTTYQRTDVDFPHALFFTIHNIMVMQEVSCAVFVVIKGRLKRQKFDKKKE
jgi:hypothetical protein